MRQASFALAWCALLVHGVCFAQQPVGPHPEPAAAEQPAPALQATPEAAAPAEPPAPAGAAPAAAAAPQPYYPYGPYYQPPGPYAYPAPDRSAAEKERAERRKKRAYLHDGFYLRFGLGGGFLRTSSAFEGTLDGSSAAETIGDISYSGSGIALDFVIGGCPVPGFALAYGFAGQIAHEPTVTLQDAPGGEQERDAEDPLGLSVHGIAVDIFPDPKGTLELGGLVGIAMTGTGPEDSDSVGMAAALWGGYGIWASEAISLAGLLRIAYARTGDKYTPTGTTTPSTIDRVDETLTLSLIAAFLLN